MGAPDVDGEEQLEPPGSQSLSHSQHSSKSRPATWVHPQVKQSVIIAIKICYCIVV